MMLLLLRNHSDAFRHRKCFIPLAPHCDYYWHGTTPGPQRSWAESRGLLQWPVTPGKEGLEYHVIVWNLTRQFSGQIQTVDIRGLIIIVSLMKLFKYIHFFKSINVYHRTSHHKHSR